MAPTVNKLTAIRPRRLPRPSKSVRIAGTPTVSATEARKNSTETANHCSPFSSAIRRVSDVSWPVGSSKAPTDNAVAPATSADAE